VEETKTTDSPEEKTETEKDSAVVAKKEDEPKKEDDTAVLTDATFESLGVVEAIVEACNASGWKTATRIQKEVLPYAFQGRDVIGLAETGSG